jgi:hypothetical protein
MRVHTQSVAMCWAGCNRLAAIAQHLGLQERAAHWAGVANRIQSRLIEQAWNEQRSTFTGFELRCAKRTWPAKAHATKRSGSLVCAGAAHRGLGPGIGLPGHNPLGRAAANVGAYHGLIEGDRVTVG